MKWERFLILFTKVNSKWIKDQPVRPETMKFLEENIGRIFCDINCSNICLALSFKAEEIKAKTNTGA